ncbi:MAG: tetratricopeptide repeat protein [Gammaproteobacteria bacterium]|nr:tetratricopeptide repeat protein [Gammaproteobacteria bacterium]
MDVKPVVFEVEMQSFQTEVVERSREVPVLLLLWTEQVSPAAEMKRTLEGLAAQYQGKFALALSDVAKDQALAQQLRVQGIPSLRVINEGQIADQMEGPQDESVLRELIDRLTLSDSELLKGSLEQHLEAKDWDAALAVLQQSIDEEPNNPAFKVEWADLLVLKGDIDGARTVLATIAEDVVGRDRPANRLELLEEAAGMASFDQVEQRIAADGADLDARYEAAVLLAVEGRFEEALEHAMFILMTDREYRDDIGRRTMLRILTVMGSGSDVAKSYRRRMFNFMH